MILLIFIIIIINDPIHIQDIHALTNLSMEGQYVAEAFQGTGKHNQTKKEIIL